MRGKMKLLEDRIRKDGIISEGDVLSVSSFLNHQMDVGFLCELGREFERLFHGEKITKILTIEASGIGIACLAAQYFGVPVLFAKKGKTDNISSDVYATKVFSYTHKKEYSVVVSKEFLHKDDKILIIDDFLATGNAIIALVELCEAAGCEIVGAGAVIEKTYQNGRRILEERGLKVESLARISKMSVEGGVEFC